MRRRKACSACQHHWQAEGADPLLHAAEEPFGPTPIPCHSGVISAARGVLLRAFVWRNGATLQRANSIVVVSRPEQGQLTSNALPPNEEFATTPHGGSRGPSWRRCPISDACAKRR